MERNVDSTTVELGTEMDEDIAGVMPEDWHGHARLTIRRQHGNDLSPEQVYFAEELSRRLLDNGKVSSAEKAALAAIKQAKEKL